MKILLFSRPQIAPSAADIERIFSLIERYGFDFAINQEFATVVEEQTARKIEAEKIYTTSTGEQPAESVMLCCGGDGTLLEGVQRLHDKSTVVAGINFGHLGFLTTAKREGVEALFEDIANGSLEIRPRTMLQVEGLTQCGGVATALNEVAAQRLEATMLKVIAKVDNQVVAQYNGDGVIVATPTGSTAYSLSAGGPIIAPDANVFVLTPIASHSLNARPVVVNDRTEVTLKVVSRSHNYLVAIDGRNEECDENTTLTLRKAAYTIKIVKVKGQTFFKTLHDKMMWGADLRN